MTTYRQFIFDSYAFDKSKKQLNLHYSLDDKLTFTEIYRFDFDFSGYNDAVLDRAIQLLFFVAGISYYKTFLPPQIVVRQGVIDNDLAKFLSKTYQQGLGEFFYTNKLDPDRNIAFPTTVQKLQAVNHQGDGLLVGLGGGKDS